jgi:ribonuclease BN (tRNA processing enzyme)
MFGLGHDLGPVELWLPARGADHLRGLGRLLGTEDMFDRTFAVHEYAEGEPFAAAGFDVVALKLPHYTLTTYGLRVTSNGRTLAYSGDSGPSERLVEVARDADLFLCEATLEAGDLDGEPRGHLDVGEAVAAFEASGARRLLLTHRPDELPVVGDWERATPRLALDV